MRKILALALVAAFGALVACNKSEEAKPAVDSTVAPADTAKKDSVKADSTKKDSAAAPKADSAKK
jgi:nitrous oxide reductase accessory protein NosL